MCGVFSETAPLQRSSTAPLKAYVQSAIFLRKRACALYSACVFKVLARVAPRILHFSAFILFCIALMEEFILALYWLCFSYMFCFKDE